MLDDFTFTGRELLLAVALASLVYLLEVLVFSRRNQLSQNRRLEARLEKAEQEIAALGTRLETLEARPPADSALDLQRTLHAEAVSMARNGASAQELSNHLGISLTEADLIIALHKSEP